MRDYKKEAKLNAETNVFTKYVDHILAHRGAKKSMSY